MLGLVWLKFSELKLGIEIVFAGEQTLPERGKDDDAGKNEKDR
jgi:hypothetical protein